MGVREIAAKYGINEGAAHRRLHRARVVKRPNTVSDDDVALIHALGTDDLSYDRIAARVGVSAGTVRDVLKRTGR